MTIDLSALSPAQMREILAAAKAKGWAPPRAGKDQPHIVSSATKACTRCGADARAMSSSPVCGVVPMGAGMTAYPSARGRALGRPMPAMPPRGGGRPLPRVDSRLVLDAPGPIGSGRSCDAGCDAHAVSRRCPDHAPI